MFSSEPGGVPPRPWAVTSIGRESAHAHRDGTELSDAMGYPESAPEVRGPVVMLDHLNPQTNHLSIP